MTALSQRRGYASVAGFIVQSAPAMQALQLERRFASDRRELAYYAIGSGPALLFANGLGASWRGFHNQLVHLASRYRCLVWDYRGLFGERGTGDGACALEEHAADALAILDSEGAERAAIVGWSLGVQVALQLFAFAPDRIAALALVSGSSNAGWSRSAAAPGLRRLYPSALELFARAPSLVSRLVRAGGRSPELVSWARRIGLVGKGADPELVAELARELARLDMTTLLATLRSMGDLDLSDVLSTVDVPTLVIGGDRDPFMSRAQLESMAQGIAGSECLVLSGGSHYVLIDHAEHVNLRLDKFFAERGY
jgi:pimeloyl-ACP methyl ester carboxylesterase